MAENKLLPPTPTHSAWVAYAVVFPALLVALLSSPIWMSAYVAMKLLKRSRKHVRGFISLRARSRRRSLSEQPSIHGSG